jgi:hypothetical protein
MGQGFAFWTGEGGRKIERKKERKKEGNIMNVG